MGFCAKDKKSVGGLRFPLHFLTSLLAFGAELICFCCSVVFWLCIWQQVGASGAGGDVAGAASHLPLGLLSVLALVNCFSCFDLFFRLHSEFDATVIKTNSIGFSHLNFYFYFFECFLLDFRGGFFLLRFSFLRVIMVLRQIRTGEIYLFDQVNSLLCSVFVETRTHFRALIRRALEDWGVYPSCVRKGVSKLETLPFLNVSPKS